MKTRLLVILLCVCTHVNATTYYFSSVSGDDSRSNSAAQDPNTPWKTLTKLNAIFSTLNAGDSILLKRGDAFYGSLNITKSGTASLPIIISAYGTGNRPVITGLTTLSNWIATGNGIWESTNSSLGVNVNILLMNDAAQEMGRYPNANAPMNGYLTLEQHVANTSITDNELTASPAWTGGEVVIRKMNWILDRNIITSHTGNTINYTSGSPYNATDNFGYFIQSHIGTLDVQGEWYYNPAQKKMHIYTGANNPGSYSIKASSIDNVITATNQSNIVFDNLAVTGANSFGFTLDNGSNITVKNCDILYSGVDGLKATNQQYLKVENCNVFNSNNNGIYLQYGNSFSTIRNNKLKDTYLFAGMGKSSDGNGIAIGCYGNNNLVEFNEVTNSGYIGIGFQGDDVTIRNNYINRFCFNKDDGGGIYTYAGHINPPVYQRRKVTGNIIVNGIGAPTGVAGSSLRAEGLYFDDNSSGIEARDNTVANCSDYGIFFNNAHEIILKNNTIFNNGIQLYMSRNFADSYIVNNEVTGNILFSKHESQTVSSLNSIGNDIRNFGSFDSNYYARPIADDMVIYNAYVDGSGKATNAVYDLEGWKAVSQKDGASKRTAVQIPRYVVNSVTGTNKYINGNFDANIGGFYSWAASNNITTKWSSGKLDGGALEVVYTQASGTSNNSVVNVGIGAVTAGKTYRVKFSLLGSANNISIAVYVRKTTSPFTILTEKKYCKISTVRQENEILFTAPAAESDASLTFEINDQNFSYWLDNLQMNEVNATQTNPDDHIVFEYNAGNANKTVALNGNYVDARNKLYSNSMVLTPYSSVVLIKQGGTVKSDQTISFPALSTKTYGDPAFNLGASASSGLPVTYRIVSGPATISNNTISINGVGVVVIEASQAGNLNYNAAAPVSQSFSVIKANQQINFGALSNKTLGDPAFALNATATSGLAVSFRVVSGPATISGNIITMNNTGTVVIEASQPGNANYNAAATVSQSFNVTAPAKTNQTINFAAITPKVFGDAPFALTATATSGLPVSFRIVSGSATLSGNTITLTGTGTVVIEATQAGNNTYNAAPAVTQSFSVTSPAKTNQMISFPAISPKVLGIAPFALTATASSGLPVSFRVISGAATVAGNLVTLNGTGTITVEASQPGNSNFNPAPVVTQSFNVTAAAKKDQTIQFAAIGTRVLGEAPFAINATASSGLEVALRIVSGPATIAGNNVTVNGTGTVVIEAAQAGNSEYNPATPVNRSFNVTAPAKKEQTINFIAIGSKVAGAAPFAVTATASSGLAVNFRVLSGPASISSNIVTLSGTGSVIIEAYQGGNSEYNAASVSQSFTVSSAAKINQTIDFPAIKSVNFKTTPFALAATATSGLPVSFRVVSGPATISGNMLTLTGIGKIVVEGSQAGNNEYNPAQPVTQSFSSSKAYQTILFPELPHKNYGDPAFMLSATSSSGLPVTFSIVSGPARMIEANKVELTGTGTVIIRASQAGNEAFNPVVSSQEFTVYESIKVSRINCYPNPVKTTATIEVFPEVVGEGVIEIFDLHQRSVMRLFSGTLQKGVAMSFNLNAKDLVNGVYIIALRTKGKIVTHRITIMH